MRSSGGKARGLVLAIALLGVVLLTALWLARPPDDAQAPPHLALPITAAPRESLATPVLPVLAIPPPAAVERMAEPMALVSPEPDEASLNLTARGSLEVTLTDTWGSEIALGPFDFLTLTSGPDDPNPPEKSHVQPDGSGHIVVRDLLPGCYAGTLSTGIAGSISRSDVEVKPGERTREAFRHFGMVLSRRIAVRVSGVDPESRPRPSARDVLLHGEAIGVRSAVAYGADVFVFDDVPPGRYDLELRANPTQSRWLSAVSPGTLRETFFDLAALPLEAGSTAATTKP